MLVEHHRHRVAQDFSGYLDGRPLDLLDMELILHEVSTQRGMVKPMSWIPLERRGRA